MASKVVSICEEKVCPIIEKLGYDVLEVEYAKKQDGMNLTFFIDKPEGIKIEDCEKVNNAITDLLDELNVTNDEQYLLNVSSPGLDRPVKNYKDFLRNKNKTVEVSLYVKQNGCKKFAGLLTNYTDSTVEIVVDGKNLTFNLKDVSQITPVIEI